METDKGFLSDFGAATKAVVEVDAPVGIPKVFMPMDTCGYLLHRREMEILNRDKSLPDKTYIVNVHTRSQTDNPDKGLVIKIFDKESEETSLMHIQGNALLLMCNDAGEPDLLKDITNSLNSADMDDWDDTNFAASEKVDHGQKAVELMDYLCDIILPNFGVFFNDRKKVVPYLRVTPKGLEGLM